MSTGLKGFTNVFQYTLNNDILDGLIEFFDWGLMEKGNYFNVTLNESSPNGEDYSRLRMVDEPRFEREQRPDQTALGLEQRQVLALASHLRPADLTVSVGDSLCLRLDTSTKLLNTLVVGRLPHSHVYVVLGDLLQDVGILVRPVLEPRPSRILAGHDLALALENVEDLTLQANRHLLGLADDVLSDARVEQGSDERTGNPAEPKTAHRDG